MLVLTRGPNQSIVIDHDIVVTVLEVRGEQVRLGISAPDHVQIHRQEVFEAVQEANRQAARSSEDLSTLDGLARPPTAPAPTAPAPAAADRSKREGERGHRPEAS
ncbi:MAG: carbon storage regulator CsrA [Acidimicrobiales bacterium]